jgi:hypothetical protein
LPAAAEQPLSTPRRRDAYVALGVDLTESVGFAPHKASPGLGFAFELRRGWMSLGLEARVAASLPAPVYPPAVHVETVQAMAAVVPCAHFGPAFACPIGEFGWSQAWGTGLVQNAADGAPLVAVGGRLGATVALSSSVGVRFFVEGVADLDRPQIVADYQPAWTAPVFAGSAGAGLFAKIP